MQFYTDVFDQNKPSAKFADLKTDVEGVLWKYLESYSSSWLKTAGVKFHRLPRRIERRWEHRWLGNIWVACRTRWGLLRPGSVLWLSKERPYTQKEQESFFIITSSKTWNFCIFICKKQYFPCQHNLYFIFLIFLSLSSQRLTIKAVLKASVVTELRYELKCKSYGNENMWIRKVGPSIWFHERLSGKLKTASLFFINKS